MIMRFAPLGALALAAACTTGGPGGPNSFVTSEGMHVSYTTVDQPFTVSFKADTSDRDYWCAAGRGGERIASPTSRIYRVTPNPRPKGADMVFSMVEPAGGGQPTGLATIGQSQNFQTVSQATQLCRPPSRN